MGLVRLFNVVDLEIFFSKVDGLRDEGVGLLCGFKDDDDDDVVVVLVDLGKGLCRFDIDGDDLSGFLSSGLNDVIEDFVFTSFILFGGAGTGLSICCKLVCPLESGKVCLDGERTSFRPVSVLLLFVALAISVTPVRFECGSYDGMFSLSTSIVSLSKPVLACSFALFLLAAA